VDIFICKYLKVFGSVFHICLFVRKNLWLY